MSNQKATTKKAQAITIYKKATIKGVTTSTRQNVLARLQQRLDMTPATAKRYYQAINSGTWA